MGEFPGFCCGTTGCRFLQNRVLRAGEMKKVCLIYGLRLETERCDDSRHARIYAQAVGMRGVRANWMVVRTEETRRAEDFLESCAECCDDRLSAVISLPCKGIMIYFAYGVL
jgi:hypothetical protein